MNLFNDPALLRATLAGYDEEERQAEQSLRNLAQHGSRQHYRVYQRAVTKMRKQIATRRALLTQILEGR